jgi:hypothetical protein
MRRKKMKNRIKEYTQTGLINPLKCVYVAGKISDPDPLQVFKNLSLGIEVSSVLVRMGYAVFSPFIDFQLFLHVRNNEHQITLQMIQDSSLAWLVKSDAMLVLPNYKTSKGTLKEIEIAKFYGIPIYYNIDDFQKAHQ